MKMANNVVVFPKAKSENTKAVSNFEEIQRNVDNMKHYHIQETILNLAPIIFNNLDIAGFGLSDEETDDVKDGALIIEALRSYMCKYYGEYHPFQIIAENVFVPKDDEEGAFKIVEELAIDLKNPETE